MRARTRCENASTRWLRIESAKAYYSLNGAKIKELAREADAFRKVGRVVLIDRDKLDLYLETMCESEGLDER